MEYGYKCEYCDGTVRPKMVVREAFSRRGCHGCVISSDPFVTLFFPIRCFGKLAEGLIAVKKDTKVFVEKSR